jgi:hypothetical protein
MLPKSVSLKQAAYILGKNPQNMFRRIKREMFNIRYTAHYPGAYRCECERKNWLFPIELVKYLLKDNDKYLNSLRPMEEYISVKLKEYNRKK